MPVVSNYISNDDLIGWEINLSMDNGPTASITLNNQSLKYNVSDLINQPVEITLNTEQPAGGYTKWFGGIISGQRSSYSETNRQTTLNCVSYFNRFQKKPINTEKFGNSPGGWETPITGKQLLSTLVGTFGCIPYLTVSNDGHATPLTSNFFDFNTANSISLNNICISENSLADGLKKVAQGILQELYVTREGKLITANFKTNNSTIDYVQPSYYIKDAEPNVSNEYSFSRVRVRARYFNEEELTPATVIYIPVTITGLKPSGIITFPMNLPFGTSPDIWKTAYYYTSSSQITQLKFIKIDQNIATLQANNSTLIPANSSITITLAVTQKPLNNDLASSLGVVLGPTIKGSTGRAINAIGNLVSTNRLNRIGTYRSIKPTDEREPTRIEVIKDDLGLIDSLGVVWEEIDNPYITTQELAEQVAIRHFVSMVQASNTWSVNCAYDPNINLNGKVTITIPGLTTQVTLLIRTINLRYNAADANLEMSYTGEVLGVP